MWDTPGQYTLTYNTPPPPPSVRLEAEIPAGKTNLYLDEWRRSEGQINVEILIHAAMQGETTLNSFSLTEKIRNWDELLSKVCVCVYMCVCMDDKRDTVTRWQIVQIQQRHRPKRAEMLRPRLPPRSWVTVWKHLVNNKYVPITPHELLLQACAAPHLPTPSNTWNYHGALTPSRWTTAYADCINNNEDLQHSYVRPQT